MFSPHRKQNILEKIIQLILKCSLETVNKRLLPPPHFSREWGPGGMNKTIEVTNVGSQRYGWKYNLVYLPATSRLAVLYGVHIIHSNRTATQYHVVRNSE